MVLVRSPKRGPWQRPASPPPAAADEGELLSAAAAAAGEQKFDSRPNDMEQEGGSPPAAPDEAGVAATAAAATSGRRSSAERGASYASVSFFPLFPQERRRSRPSSLSRRKSVSCCAGVVFSEAATQSTSSAICRRGVPRAAAAAAPAEAHAAAAAADARNALAADVRNAAAAAAPASNETPAAGRAAAAAREPTPRTAAALPFSRSAARRLARMPSHTGAAAAGTHVGGDAATAGATAAATPGGRGGFGGHRGPALRHASRVPASAAGETVLNSKADSLRLRSTHAAAAGVSNVSKRVRYEQQSSPPRSSRSNVEEMSRSSLDSRRIIPSFRLSRKPSTSAAVPAADFPLPVPRRPAAAAAAATQGARSSPREGVSPTAMTPAGLVHSVQPAEEITCASTTEFPAAAAELPAESQQQLQQHNVQAVELLQQLPATRALHDYVLEATTSSGLLRQPHVKKKESSAAVHFLPGDRVSPAASADAAAAPSPASDAGEPALPFRSPPSSTPLPAAAAAGTAKTSLGPNAAASPRAVSTSSRATAAASGTDHLAAVAAPPLAAAAVMRGSAAAAAGSSARTVPSSTGGSGVSSAPWITRSSSSCEKQQQQLVLPRSAEELLREWSPTVDNLIQRLCDVREEEKQVTQFIILEGRSLRLLRHVAKALEMKRTEVAAVHAKVAQQEAKQEEAHAESGKCFEVVHREAKDAAGGEVHLERRLKNTREKKERLLQLRRQLYEEMFGCALLREKKVELAKHVSSLKDSFAREEARKNALYLLLQSMTRLRFLRHVHNRDVLRVAVIPEGMTQHTQQQLADEEEEEEEFLVPEQPKEGRNAVLRQQRAPSREEDLLLLQHQQEGANKKKRQTYELSGTHQQQHGDREDHTGRSNETDDRKHRKHAIGAGVPSRESSDDDCALQYQRGMYVGNKAAKELHDFTKQFHPGHEAHERRKGSGSTAAEETPDTGETESDVLSSTDEEENCRRLIAAKTAGEAALITVDCRKRDDTTGVCKAVDALWTVIEDAIGLPPE